MHTILVSTLCGSLLRTVEWRQVVKMASCVTGSPNDDWWWWWWHLPWRWWLSFFTLSRYCLYSLLHVCNIHFLCDLL